MRTDLHIPSSSDLFVISVKLEAKGSFRVANNFLFQVMWSYFLYECCNIYITVTARPKKVALMLLPPHSLGVHHVIITHNRKLKKY
jgi:hypothetical protein